MRVQVTGRKDKPMYFIYLPKSMIAHLQLKRGTPLTFKNEITFNEENEKRGFHQPGKKTVTISREEW